jgi:hypothetical protein
MKDEKEDILKKELGEDSTKYGENVCSTFNWLPKHKQKQRARELEEMTEVDNEKK